MQVSRTHIGIAVGAGALIVVIFLGYLMWLSKQPPILSRSEERDPLSGMPLNIKLNPLRDRTIERVANKFVREMRDGHCRDVLARWEKDYRKNMRVSSANRKRSIHWFRGNSQIGKMRRRW